MSDMDKLLAQLKAEYKPEKKPSPPSKSSSSATPFSPKSEHNLEEQNDNQLDRLLSDLKAEFTPEKPRNNQQNSNKTPKSTTVSSTPLDRKAPTVNNNLINDLKKEYQAQAKEEQQRRQQELREQKQREQERERRRRQALRQEAQEWLKNLNLKSDEGLWFEEFSYSYDSKIEAAIDYLQAIRETRGLR